MGREEAQDGEEGGGGARRGGDGRTRERGGEATRDVNLR